MPCQVYPQEQAMDNLDAIKRTFRSGDYKYTQHAVERTTERKITRREIEQAVERGEIIENYPNDKYGPSCLIYGSTDDGRPLHLQCSLPPKVKLITAYEPDPAEWIDNRIRRLT
jgi:hypothetical protein